MNRYDHFLSKSDNLESVEGAVDFPCPVDEDEDAGRLGDLTDLSGLTDLEGADFLSDFFSDFPLFSSGPLKPEAPEVPWPSTTPTTDTSAGSTRVGLRVSESLMGVEDLASFRSFFSL